MANVRLTSFTVEPTILQVIPSLGIGGAEIEAVEIAKAVVRAGGRALIASGEKAEKKPDDGIEYRYIPLQTKNPLQIIKNVFLLKTLIVKENVSLVHARSRGPAWSAYKASRALNVPFVTTYHADYKSRSYLKTCYNSVMARGERVIAISHYIQNRILQLYGRAAWFKGENLRLVERGIDLSVFDPSALSQERLDQARFLWRARPGRTLVLLPGRITSNKGHKTLIEALSLLKNKKVDLILLGSDANHETYRDSLLKLAASLGLSGRVKWMPPAPDLPAAYALADLIVCPSLVPEGFGRVVAEAQAMKKPIIVSAHGAAPEVIEEGVTGWTFPVGSAHALAETLEQALALSPEERQEMGERGRARVQEKYDQRLMESKTMEIYKELLDR